MRALLALIALLAASPAAAQVVSEKPDRVAVVLYQDHAPRFRPFAIFVASPEIAVIAF